LTGAAACSGSTSTSGSSVGSTERALSVMVRPSCFRCADRRMVVQMRDCAPATQFEREAPACGQRADSVELVTQVYPVRLGRYRYPAGVPDRAALVDLLGALAYGELCAFDRLADDARMAPDLVGRAEM